MIKIKYNLIDFPSVSPYKNDSYILEIEDHELYHAAYTVGKPSWRQVHSNIYAEHEINLRISMIKTFLDLEGES